ncbi:hypothetical protein LCGC14_2039680 [marine sediment metagenome]|uniref:Uncharacterized protein n=1 Tax=marine sediment metagenome TaxID=412755 RepID=A0A0F9FEV1_9ZZZZ
MLVTVKTPVGNGQVVGFAVESASDDYDSAFHVLVATEKEPLRVFKPEECIVLTVEPEYVE